MYMQFQIIPRSLGSGPAWLIRRVRLVSHDVQAGPILFVHDERTPRKVTYITLNFL